MHTSDALHEKSAHFTLSFFADVLFHQHIFCMRLVLIIDQSEQIQVMPMVVLLFDFHVEFSLEMFQ